MEERIYDYSALSMFQECRKKYWFSMVKHLQTKKKAMPLIFGTAVHEALDIWYMEGDIEKAVAKFKEEHEEREWDTIRTMATGETLVREYARVYKHEAFSVIGKPEPGFVMPISDFMYGGRLDTLIDWDGQLWVLEHKTTTRLDVNYFKQFDMDKQITGYIIGAEFHSNKKVTGALVNALEVWKPVQRVSSRTKKPEDHFQRSPQTRSQEIKDRFILNVQRLVRDIRWCMENDEWMEAEKKESCRSYNNDCPYKELCKWGWDDKVVEREFRIEEWSPRKKETKKEE